MITIIFIIYLAILILGIAYKAGEEGLLNLDIAWLALVVWPICIILIIGNLANILWQHKIYPMIQLLMFVIFKKSPKVNKFSINVVYNNCLMNKFIFSKWRARVIERIADFNNIELYNRGGIKRDSAYYVGEISDEDDK